MKILLILNLIIEVILTCLIPWSKSVFFDQLSSFSIYAWYGLGCYIGISILLDIIQNFKPFLITLYTNIKRTILTQHYYNLGHKLETRSQRIQEDIKLFTINQTTVYSEYFVSGLIVLILIIQNFHFTFLILSSIIYSIFCIIISFLFKPKMIEVEKNIQQKETEFRDIIREQQYFWCEIKHLFENVIKSNIKSATVKFNYGLCVKLQTGIMTLLPYIYLLPKYLTKQISLGIMMEQASIFQLLVINMIILTQLFPQWMQAHASKQRLEELKNDIPI